MRVDGEIEDHYHAEPEGRQGQAHQGDEHEHIVEGCVGLHRRYDPDGQSDHHCDQESVHGHLHGDGELAHDGGHHILVAGVRVAQFEGG